VSLAGRFDSTPKPAAIYQIGQSLRSRPGPRPAGLIEPALPSARGLPPSGSDWLHEIKFDGFRMLARRDGVRVRLFTRNGYDWTDRFPLIRAGMLAVKAQSCLVDGEAVCCEVDGVPSFELLRYRHHDGAEFLYAFDLLELDGRDIRSAPLEERRATLTKILRPVEHGVHLSLSKRMGQLSFATLAPLASRVSYPSARARRPRRPLNGKPKRIGSDRSSLTCAAAVWTTETTYPPPCSCATIHLKWSASPAPDAGGVANTVNRRYWRASDIENTLAQFFAPPHPRKEGTVFSQNLNL
jgi:bifunctional non-homologous end joining protein LigD